MAGILDMAREDLLRKEADAKALAKEIQDLREFIRRAEHYEYGAQPEPGHSARERIIDAIMAAPSKKERITMFAERLLSDGTPRSTRAILSAMGEAGIKVGGATEADQVMNLSGYLSREKSRFQTDRINGWSLKTSGPTSVAAQVGPGY